MAALTASFGRHVEDPDRPNRALCGVDLRGHEWLPINSNVDCNTCARKDGRR